MNVWITSIEWETPSEDLPMCSASKFLKLEVKSEEVIGDVLADIYKSIPREWCYRLYEPDTKKPFYMLGAWWG